LPTQGSEILLLAGLGHAQIRNAAAVRKVQVSGMVPVAAGTYRPDDGLSAPPCWGHFFSYTSEPLVYLLGLSRFFGDGPGAAQAAAVVSA
jgi:hypothetical protein